MQPFQINPLLFLLCFSLVFTTTITLFLKTLTIQFNPYRTQKEDLDNATSLVRTIYFKLMICTDVKFRISAKSLKTSLISR